MKEILDACCGGRKFWFDKQNEHVLFVDCRSESHVFPDGSKVDVRPDVIADFRNLPFLDESFYHVVFDPPHLRYAGESSIMGKMYGHLNKLSWREDIRRGFYECMRVLKRNGILVFKWSEKEIKVKTIIEIIGMEPLYGHRTNTRTIWMAFMKF